MAPPVSAGHPLPVGGWAIRRAFVTRPLTKPQGSRLDASHCQPAGPVTAVCVQRPANQKDAMSGNTRLHCPVTRQGEQVDHYFPARPWPTPIAGWRMIAAPRRSLGQGPEPGDSGYLAQIPYRAAIRRSWPPPGTTPGGGAVSRGRYHYFFRTTACRTRTCCGASRRGQAGRGVPRSQYPQPRRHHGAGSAELLPRWPHPGLLLVAGRQRLARDPPDGRREQAAAGGALRT